MECTTVGRIKVGNEMDKKILSCFVNRVVEIIITGNFSIIIENIFGGTTLNSLQIITCTVTEYLDPRYFWTPVQYFLKYLDPF